uniref:Uncharacterized protein n=1 Tax=Rhizophora mucronata TaxID=61149 RepID=A0A2P2J0F0_RHIMU
MFWSFYAKDLRVFSKSFHNLHKFCLGQFFLVGLRIRR